MGQGAGDEVGSAKAQIPISKLGWLSVAPRFMQFCSSQLRQSGFPFVRIVHKFRVKKGQATSSVSFGRHCVVIFVLPGEYDA